MTFSFPKFISLIFRIEQIPNIQKNLKTIFHKKAKNDVTLQYLCQKKNDFIRKSNPKLDTLHDKTNLLRIILSKLGFTVNIPDIVRKSNLLLYNCSIHNANDLMNHLFILNLLNVITEHKIQIEADVTQQNFNEIMSKNFKIVQVPFFINYESMKTSSQDIFLIQMQFIFDAYSEKINNLLENRPIERTEYLNQNEENESLKKTEDLKQDEIKNNEKESLKNTKHSEQNAIENYESNQIKNTENSEQNVNDENNNEEPNKIGFNDKNNANETENNQKLLMKMKKT